MIQTKLRGMGVALITPFKEDESVDYNALMRLEDYLVQNNADFLCVLGTTAETPTLTEEEKKKKDSPVVTVHDSHEIQEAGEKMESDRVEFMSTELGMSEDKIAQHNKIRDEFFKKTAEFWQKNPMRELNFKERRQMIELEEEVHRKLEKLHGKKNWERYQKFRESYNQKGFKKQMEDGQPFLFMGL